MDRDLPAGYVDFFDDEPEELLMLLVVELVDADGGVVGEVGDAVT